METLFISSLPFFSRSSFVPKSNSALSKASVAPRTPPIRRVMTSCVEMPEWKRVAVDIDFAKDEQLEKLEEQLDDAIANEQYQLASEIRDKLLRLQSGSYVEVLSANMKFYQAFNKATIVDMAGCWLQDNSATCKHPLGPMAVGYLEIINGFGALFSLELPAIEVRNVRISMRGTAAIVSCEEHAIDWDIGEQSRTVMCAVNIFVKRNGQWYLLHHSALPVLGDKIRHAR